MRAGNCGGQACDCWRIAGGQTATRSHRRVRKWDRNEFRQPTTALHIRSRPPRRQHLQKILSQITVYILEAIFTYVTSAVNLRSADMHDTESLRVGWQQLQVRRHNEIPPEWNSNRPNSHLNPTANPNLIRTNEMRLSNLNRNSFRSDGNWFCLQWSHPDKPY